MITKARFATVVVVVALALVGCGGKTPPEQTARPASPAPKQPVIPVPVLKVGEPFAADLLGDGRATVTVVATEVSTVRRADDPSAPQGRVQLVVTVKILLDKAGEPIMGGPRNFIFRDAKSTLHPARTNRAAFPPELAVANFTTAGQHTDGKIVFDLPPDLVTGGQIQLITGQLVHAIWSV
ncbi:MAG TPA: hypothetical protein VFM54_11225 [Micromonosporaceae bacterium]|nr:hypothetical protein [Micromonosporaceae bacterium]